MQPHWIWTWPFQRYIIEQLDRLTVGEIERLMLFVPPRHGKSELVTVRYSAWRLERKPESRVLVGAYNQLLADRFSRKVRRIVAERCSIAGERRAVHEWETTAGGGLRAAGVGAGVTGMGADVIVIDDPVKNQEEADSELYRERVWDWYTTDLYTRLEPGGQIVLIMTRWHEDDLAGRILASEDGPNWTVISLPAEAEPDDPLGREVGEPLCPERYDLEALADRKRVLGTRRYISLYQQRPAPAEGNVIKRAWLRWYEQPPARFDRVIASWDMAFKETQTGSFVVGQVWGRIGADFYLIDQVRDRWGFSASQEEVKKLSARHPEARGVYVEEAANGPAIIESLRRTVSGLVGVRATGSKLARMEAVSPLFEAGNVYLPRDREWIEDYVHELTTFPNAANDDQCDASSQALTELSVRRQSVLALSRSGAERQV